MTRSVVVAAPCVVAAAMALLACDARTAIAQYEVFAPLRPALVDECCACLAARGTGHPEATCTEAVLVDGEAVVPPGALYGNGVQDREDNDVVDDGEIPCLCGDLGDDGCRATLQEPAGRLVVPGACIDQSERRAPCEDACGGVLAFVPLNAEDPD
ncbi:MAG: hypothetical protein FJ137_06510 [Deltaproteobacteria bacterium]|nr:hypothetical protein [Deltaproteobacteria bacterium]